MGGRSLKRRWALNVSHSSGCTPALVQERVRADRIGTSSTGAPIYTRLKIHIHLRPGDVPRMSPDDYSPPIWGVSVAGGGGK